MPERTLSVSVARRIEAILELLADSIRMPIVILANVDASFWTVVSAIDRLGLGLRPAIALPLDRTFCGMVRRTGAPLVIADAGTDVRLRAHAAFVERGIRSYVGVPLRFEDGAAVGTLCALDRTPHVALEATVARLTAVAPILADSVDHHLLCDRDAPGR